MNMLLKLFEGVNAAFKGMLGVAGFGVLAIVLALLMLKMKGTEGREIASNKPKLKVTQASMTESPVLPDIPKIEIAEPRIEMDPNSFSFGNSIEQDKRHVLDLSQDPNALR